MRARRARERAEEPDRWALCEQTQARIAELEDNEQLDREFDSYESAMTDLKAGINFAALVTPASFSRDTPAITTGNFQQQTIQHHANEKTGPVASKITDTAEHGGNDDQRNLRVDRKHR